MLSQLADLLECGGAARRSRLSNTARAELHGGCLHRPRGRDVDGGDGGDVARGVARRAVGTDLRHEDVLDGPQHAICSGHGGRHERLRREARNVRGHLGDHADEDGFLGEGQKV